MYSSEYTTVGPRRVDPFYIVTYCIKWVKSLLRHNVNLVGKYMLLYPLGEPKISAYSQSTAFLLGIERKTIEAKLRIG